MMTPDSMVSKLDTFDNLVEEATQEERDVSFLWSAPIHQLLVGSCNAVLLCFSFFFPTVSPPFLLFVFDNNSNPSVKCLKLSFFSHLVISRYV